MTTETKADLEARLEETQSRLDNTLRYNDELQQQVMDIQSKMTVTVDGDESAAVEGPKIFPAMLAILRDVAPIPKGQTNQQQGYAFRGIDDVMDALHPLFARHGVFVAPGVRGKEYGESVSARGTKMTDAYLTLSYRFYAEDGSYVDAEVAGESRDAADKATNQASSSAFKYLLLQMFVIPLTGTKEADHQSPEAVIEGAISPDTRAKKAVFEATGSKDAAKQLWEKICTDLKIADGGMKPLALEEEADLIIHQLRSYLPPAS